MSTGQENPVTTLSAGLHLLSPEWHELPGLGLREWLWLDLVGDGAHLTSQPPGSEPPGFDVLWGWNDTDCVRLRAGDGARLVGARLTRRPEDGDQVTGVTEVPLESWGADRRVRLADAMRNALQQRRPTMHTVVVSPTPATMTELQFVTLDAPAT